MTEWTESDENVFELVQLRNFTEDEAKARFNDIDWAVSFCRQYERKHFKDD